MRTPRDDFRLKTNSKNTTKRFYLSKFLKTQNSLVQLSPFDYNQNIASLNSSTYYAKGKFLLSAEYFVLDGALSLALPLKFGQRLEIKELEHSNSIEWKSFDYKKNIWFEASYDLRTLAIKTANEVDTAERLKDIFESIQKQQPKLFEGTGFQMESYLDFPRPWGLGTSSTLLSLLSQWSETDAYQILEETFGGSGYDIACAIADGPIHFQKLGSEIKVQASSFLPAFRDKLYFVYLGKKQNSRDGIAHYRKLDLDKNIFIKRLSEISKEMAFAKTLNVFNQLIIEHETIISQTLSIPRAKDLYFSDFEGEVKSLGAWGGDFVLVTSKGPIKKTTGYFNEKGFEVFYKYEDMVKKNNTID